MIPQEKPFLLLKTDKKVTILFNVGNLLIFREKVLDLRPKLIRAVEMPMFVHWTSIIEKLFMLE